jgi:hypothetical protein
VIITNVTDPGNPFVLEATESADPVSVIMDNLRDYQYAISDSFKHTTASLSSILDPLNTVLINLNQDNRAKFVESFLQPILYNAKVPERAIIIAMLLSMSNEDQSIFSDNEPTNSISLVHASDNGEDTKYSILRSRATDDSVRLKVLEITLSYLCRRIPWLNSGYTKSAAAVETPFEIMEDAKKLIRGMKAAIASVSSQRSKADVEYNFSNLSPEVAEGGSTRSSRSATRNPTHTLKDLNSAMKEALEPSPTPIQSNTAPSSSSSTSSTFSFYIEKKTGSNPNWKVKITIPSSSPQACFYRLTLSKSYTLKGFAVQDTNVGCVNAIASFAFALSNKHYLDKELAKQQKKSSSSTDIEVNDLRKLACRAVSDGFKAVYFAWNGSGKAARTRKLVAAELAGLGSLFAHLMQENMGFSKLMSAVVSSASREALVKRIVGNLKSLDSNKQPVSKMLFAIMSANSNATMAIPYAGVDSSQKFTAYIDTHTLSLELSDGRIVPAFDIATDIQKAVNLRLYATKSANGFECVEITSIITPNFGITRNGKTVLPMPRSGNALYNEDACRAILSPGVFWFDKCREKVSVHFPLTVHRNLHKSKGHASETHESLPESVWPVERVEDPMVASLSNTFEAVASSSSSVVPPAAPPPASTVKKKRKKNTSNYQVFKFCYAFFDGKCVDGSKCRHSHTCPFCKEHVCQNAETCRSRNPDNLPGHIVLISNLKHQDYIRLSPNQKLDLKMWKEKRAIPYTKHLFIPNRDPDAMMHESRLGRTVYFRRGLSTDHVPTASQKILNRMQSDDPGIRLFFTVFEWGFGDVFFIGAGMETDIRAAQFRLKDLQSNLSKLIDQVDSVKAARADLSDKEFAQFEPNVMADNILQDAAKKSLTDSRNALASALKQQHNPLWHKKNLESDPEYQRSQTILGFISDINETQEIVNRKVHVMRKKAALFMSARDVTLKSTFNASSFSKSDKISGGVKSVGSMYGHGKFTSHDLSHRMELLGTCLVKGTEPYSTATCATCGNCIRNQGRSKVYHCSNANCRAKHDRDEGGAKGNAIIKLAGFFFEEAEEDDEVPVVAAVPDDEDEVCY